MAKGCTSIIFSPLLQRETSFITPFFPSLDKEAPPKEVYSKKEETFCHRIATSILYDLRWPTLIFF